MNNHPQRDALQRVERLMNQLIPNLPLHLRRNNTEAIVQVANDFADLRAALSPQTLPAPPLSTDVQSAATGFHEQDVSLKVALPAPGEVERGTGWVAWNPDSGEEYTPNHPVESGECVEAERIRRSTPQEDTLWAAFQEQLMRAEALATVAAANDEGVADSQVLRAAVKNLLPIGNDQLPGDRVIPIYVRMDELRALHALATSRSQHEGASS